MNEYYLKRGGHIITDLASSHFYAIVYGFVENKCVTFCSSSNQPSAAQNSSSCISSKTQTDRLHFDCIAQVVNDHAALHD